ncbi:MAG: TonB-dependent receptor [Proteobacteria bacterium]|jgi:iron complex outermembrane receptor protein|nr:TonB-dependent receptor [Pseudomonadota bacterium]MBK7117059.1 TonB-dependent receptor [Pseudomonadota bacterium]MBK9250816.1 TonB-dependent receptor [Pseudomonadota bacterium]
MHLPNFRPASTGVLALTIHSLVLGQEAAQPQEGLEEVVVTAQRREENLQKAALAVSAVSGDTLATQSITQATDLTRLIPSIQIAPAAAFTQIYLRGVGTFGANAFAEQGVAFNLDGVYLSRPAAPAALFYDLERIEVLKGPQGTLYGRNASGGAVNLVTAKPRFGERSGFLTAEYGDYDAIKASGAINLPAGERSAFRFSGQYVDRDGYYSDGYDDEQSHALRGQYRFDSDRVDLSVMADFGRVDGKGPGGTIMPLLDGKNRLGPSDPAVIAAYRARTPTAPVPQITARNDGYQFNSYYGAMAQLDIDLGLTTLTLLPAWRKTDLDFVSYASSFLIDVTEKSKQSSLEARLASQTDKLKWVLGAYWFDESVVADQAFRQASNGTDIDSELDTKSFAVFGEATLSLSDRWRATGGVRYTDDNKTQDTEAHTLPFVGFVPPGPPNFTPIILDIPTFATSDVDFKETTWKLGLEFDAGPRSLMYASVATGFKSGILYSALGQNYSEPEKLTAFTLGSKNRFRDNTVQLNIEAFYWDYKDQQISHLGPVQVATTPGGPVFGPVFLTENAGAATISGVEAELLWQPVPQGLVSLNLQVLDTKYDELRYQAYSTTGAPPLLGCQISPTTLTGASAAARIFDVDCSGKSLVNAPKFALNAGYEHHFELGGGGRVTVGADTRIESARYLSIDFLGQGRQDSYMMSNARVTWEPADTNLALTAFVNNVENELVFSNSLQSPAKAGTVYNQLRPPRTWGVRATYRF